jgi:hypothetical protein
MSVWQDSWQNRVRNRSSRNEDVHRVWIESDRPSSCILPLRSVIHTLHPSSVSSNRPFWTGLAAQPYATTLTRQPQTSPSCPYDMIRLCSYDAADIDMARRSCLMSCSVHRMSIFQSRVPSSASSLIMASPCRSTHSMRRPPLPNIARAVRLPHSVHIDPSTSCLNPEPDGLPTHTAICSPYTALDHHSIPIR